MITNRLQFMSFPKQINFLQYSIGDQLMRPMKNVIAQTWSGMLLTVRKVALNFGPIEKNCKIEFKANPKTFLTISLRIGSL